MRINLVLGQNEHNFLEFIFNQFLGTSVIKVNQQVIKKRAWWFSEPLHQTEEVDVGSKERWHVRIETDRKLLLGHKCRVFVNERLTRVLEGV